MILRLVRLHIRLDIETLPNLARIHRQGFLAAAARVIFTSRARDRGDRAVSVVGAVAERHCLERHAVAARYIFWDVGRSRWAAGFEAAAHAEFLQSHRDERAEGGYAAGGDADTVLDCGPDGDSYGLVWGLVSP